MKAPRDAAEILEAKALLIKMEADPAFITQSAYRANANLWPEHRIPFINIHLEYLHNNPQISTKDYISNLRLKLRKS